jgi:3',5'-cyclic-AMP phosphodiesterase
MSDHHPNDRRGFLKCMAWAGSGALWTMSGGLASSISLAEATAKPVASKGFTFLQISDSHVGFAKPANPDAKATYQEAVSKIIAMPAKPDFIIHTGDITQLSKDSEFDDADQIIKQTGLTVFHVPGEHDMLDEGQGRAFLDRYGAGTKGAGWQSFDHKGVHFIALVNVVNLKAGGMGNLGADQLDWLEKDLAGRPSSQPIVVFAHIPLWTVYADWGWGTDDAAQALTYLRRFGSVTVLNGHIHQITRKVEGNVRFHTARSTAFPQPVGGQGPSPGPLKVPTEQLHSMLGITTASFVRGQDSIALIDATLAS